MSAGSGFDNEAFKDALRRNVAEIKERVDLHDLADKLGLERPVRSGNYKSPHHKDKSPSLSIFDGGTGWKDWSGDAGGDAFALVMYVNGCDFTEANRWLHDYCGMPWPTATEAPRRERSQAEFIAASCLADPEPAVAYLRDERKIPEPTIREAIKARTVGYSSWTSDKTPAGEIGHQGPAVAFIAYESTTGLPEGVDKRFIDPALNGGLKTWSKGEKLGLPWMANRRALKGARTVYVVESAINALSIEACEIKFACAMAVRGLQGAASIDWTQCHGKHVVIVFDADEPNAKDRRPGPEAAWALYDQLTALNIGCSIVDQTDWARRKLNDCNDVLKAEGVDGLRTRLRRLEDSAIAGVPAKLQPGPKRLWLPGYDFAVYGRFKAQADFTQYISDLGDDPEDDAGSDDEDEAGGERRGVKLSPLAGFRIAAISRVTIQSPKATVSGVKDSAPTTQFAATVQVPRHGPRLLRRVFRDEDLHRLARWEDFGPIYDPKQFKRLVTLFERAVHFGERRAANFVGLCWLDGKLRVNEGTDCYFERPDKQCIYHDAVFHRGTQADARAVIDAYQTTFTHNAAAIPLVWVCGAVALKCILGFWPHFEMQAKKASGKSTLIERLSGTTGFQMFSSEQLKTAYRIISSVGHSSIPVGWEEVSKAGKISLAMAITMLQESYQFTPHTRGSENLRYLNAAPVLLAGEDVPAKDITGKLVRTKLTSDKQGPVMPKKLPLWPMRNWLEWVAELDPETLVKRHERLVEYCYRNSRSTKGDLGAKRMATNYGALLLAWKLMTEFAGIEENAGDFPRDCIAEMNAHMTETEHDREPFVWILEKLASEIASDRFVYPCAWREVKPAPDQDPEVCLVVKAQYVMDHLAGSNHLRDFYDTLPIKTARVFKQQLVDAELVVDPDFRTVINGRDQYHCIAIGVKRCSAKGIDLPVRVIKDGAQTEIGRALAAEMHTEAEGLA